MKQKLVWHTEKMKVADLIPNDKNPRTLSDQQKEDLMKSLEKFNLVEIPVIDIDKKLLAGHQRALVLSLLGRSGEIIDVRVPNRKLTKGEYEQYLLISNRLHGNWNWDLLKSFDIETLLNSGFDEVDLSNVWDNFLETEDDKFDIEKEVAKIKTPKTKFGNHYQLGQHRLLCSNSTIMESVKKVAGVDKISMIYCDPPYNISLDYNKGLGTKGKYGGQEKDNKTDEEYKNFLKATMENALAVAQPDCHVFYWSDERFIGLIQYLFKELGLANRRVCMWIKNNASPTPQIAFNKIYEPCTYATRGNPYLAATVKSFTEIMNKEVGNGNRSIDDIMDLINIWLVKRMPSNEYEHPTSKPPTLHEKALRRCTKPGDTVLDLFGGSGSTLIACEQLKRRCLLIEKDPVFCDVIVNRFERLTGIKAKLIK